MGIFMNEPFRDRARSPLDTHVSEVGRPEEFTPLLVLDSGSRAGIVVQGIDLHDFAGEILGLEWQGTTFLGCPMPDEVELHVIPTGATVFPPFTGLPYDPDRSGLYAPGELAHEDLDSRIYEHQAQWHNAEPLPILEALAQRIHDHAIDDALNEYLEPHEKVVAIMGGHGLRRDDVVYRTVASLARTLTRRGHLVVTGGGPGAMEAGNLGAWLAPQADDALEVALSILAGAVGFDDSGYVAAGEAVVARYPSGSESLAIPTWFYGHEPTNVFSTAVAKYFSNSIREDGLLAIATHGVVYAPGAAGTLQEVFMDATQNH